MQLTYNQIDEMGLGKTLQSISILAYTYEYLRIQGPHIVCVPKSTLSNWIKEFKRWFPAMRVLKFHGTREEREYMKYHHLTAAAAAHDGRRPTSTYKEEDGEELDDNSCNPRSWDVCLTTYEVCNTERKILEKFAWKYLVIDEAHRLKNEASQFSRTVRDFRVSHRLLLTGTPLQNNLHELWALLNFLVPDIFNNADQFDEWFNLEIDDDAAKTGMIDQLHAILRPFMLRRLKKEVAKGLPPKTETLLMVGMSKMQKQLYKKLLLRDIESVTGKATSKGKTAILNIVMQLRKCCGHPYLFEGVEDRSLDPLGEHLVENCGKLVVVDKLLKRLKEGGHRVLIFTQMTRILDILEDYMHMRQYAYCRIDGNTEYVDREQSIEAYNAPNSEKFVFLLSTRAGGLGINLQTADTCILYDSDWNPQADLQAQDRCHRIGQQNPVNVYRLVSENTVEEKIVERAQQKLKLDAMVVQQGRLKEKDKKLDSEEILAAVRFGADVVFRSEESTISEEDIDAILARGKKRTEELNNKIQEAEKGDLLDFRLDGGISAQTFEGVDYSDQQLRQQLKLLAADAMGGGKRERRAPAQLHPNASSMDNFGTSGVQAGTSAAGGAATGDDLPLKKSMMIKNKRIKLPKTLRLPRMEDFQFFNRERLMELGSKEFQNYALLRECNMLPAKEYIEKVRTILPPELAQEKLDLLEQGFGTWTRAQYYHFIKASTKFGRTDYESIAADMDLTLEQIKNYSQAFWQFGPTELKPDEWLRASTSIVKGEARIEKQTKLNALLKKFVRTFADPRNDITFANRGTQYFALEQDRALVSAVDKLGYGNWDAVREYGLLEDEVLYFQHLSQGMDVDAVVKRCDYRMRQMEKELEARTKLLRFDKNRKKENNNKENEDGNAGGEAVMEDENDEDKEPIMLSHVHPRSAAANVRAAKNALKAAAEVDAYEEIYSSSFTNNAAQDTSKSPSSVAAAMNELCKQILHDHTTERQPMIDRLREIEIQVRNCRIVAHDTHRNIIKGSQYVNYSNISLKAGGPVMGASYNPNKPRPGPKSAQEKHQQNSNSHNSDTNAQMTDTQQQLQQQKPMEDIEAKHHRTILSIPPCGKCEHCSNSQRIDRIIECSVSEYDADTMIRRPCVLRLAERNRLFHKDTGVTLPELQGNAYISFADMSPSVAASVNVDALILKKSIQEQQHPGTVTSDANIIVAEAVPVTSSSKVDHNNDTHSNNASSISSKVVIVATVSGSNKCNKVTSSGTNNINQGKVSCVSSSSSSNANVGGTGMRRHVTSLGNKRMSVPDELVPEFAKRIGVDGTNKRSQIINNFALDYPDASVRQITIKFTQITTKTRPPCAKEMVQEKRRGKGAVFYLRPRMYKLLPEIDRPEDWEKYAEEDEILYQKEEQEKKEDEKHKDDSSKTKKKSGNSKRKMKDIEGSNKSGSPSPSVVEGQVAQIVDSSLPMKKKLRKDDEY